MSSAEVERIVSDLKADAKLQADVQANAASVPALASAAMLASGMRPAKTDVTLAVNMVMRVGVPRFDTRARLLGSRPSRATTKKIRLWP